MNKAILRWITILLLLCAVRLAAAADADGIRIQFQIFRITSTLSADLALDEAIWAGKDPISPEVRQSITLFNNGQIKLSPNRFDIAPTQWKWNGKPLPLDDSCSQTLAGVTKKASVPPGDTSFTVMMPQLIAAEGYPASIRITSNRPIVYFEKYRDNLYELKSDPMPTGLEIRVTPHKEADRILLNDFSLTLSSIDRREPLPGVPLQVGKPILTKKQFALSLRLMPGRDYGLLLSPGDGAQGVLLIRLRVALTSPGKPSTQPPKQGK